MRHRLQRAIEWIGGHELTVLLALLTITGGSWAFLELVDEVQEGTTLAFDRAVIRALRAPGDPNVPIGPVWLAESARDVTSLGGYTVLMLITGAVAGFLALDRKRAAMWFVLGAASSGLMLGILLKRIIDRPRPDVVPHLDHVISSSLPSGHSMMSAVVYLTLGSLLARIVTKRRLKFYFLTLALLITGIVGLSRVFLGVHYPTDVLAGWTAGLVWATTCWLIARTLQRRGQIESPLPLPPEPRSTGE